VLLFTATLIQHVAPTSVSIVTETPSISARLLNYMLVDYLLTWFLPSWRKKALLVLKGAKRFLNYRKDLLDQQKVDEIQEKIDSLKQALRSWNRNDTEQATQTLEGTIDVLPGASQSTLAENVEVFFVIIVIFLGLRNYVVQPFRIPTGSMQPSLNGIRVIPTKEQPSFFDRLSGGLFYGSSYVNEQATVPVRIVGYQQKTQWLLFTKTTVVFDNQTTIDVPSAQNEVMRYFEKTKGSIYPFFRPGETIIQARCDAGDMILVNKIAYHFRKPELGEVFVFDTRGIEGIKRHSAGSDQANGTHYVKRLCGLPGDLLTINSPQLMINGKLAAPWTIRRVMDRQAPYNSEGYIPATPYTSQSGKSSIRCYLGAGQSMQLATFPNKPVFNQYAAFGDNTVSSFDSRFWGPVSQYNIIGPASFALWPFTSHWGLIP
jgi:signal peptidase I